MIRELRIKNLALIDDISLEFDKGFSVFTGETGAGKSMLIGAIGLLLGERASTEMIRSGTEEAEVNGVFELGEIRPQLKSLLDELTIEPEDGSLIIRRKVTKNDRNRIHVNQVPIPLASLKKLGDFLIDLHGQHEHQSLLNEDTHGSIIDELPGVKTARVAYDRAYEIYTKAKSDSLERAQKAKTLAERKDILEFQYNELKSLSLKTGEEEELESELVLLSSSAERIECASSLLQLLGGSGEAIERKILQVKKKLETLAKFDGSVDQWLSDVDNAMTVFTELETFCGSYLDKTGSSTDPNRIEHINSRLAKIQRLKKKYNCTHDQLMEKQQEHQHNLQSLENIDADRSMLDRKVATALADCKAAGCLLTSARKKAAESFDKNITKQMETLGFKGGQWNTSFEPQNDPRPSGFEIISFLVRTNPGEPFLSLVKTASGGEISRLMLAIKTIIAENDNVPVLIFDEIDTGIGGVLACEVGKALYSLSTTHQVLCISHLHQIASLANHHYQVYKEVTSDRTVTRVRALNKEEKVSEIARMLGGESDITRQHALELINKSRV